MRNTGHYMGAGPQTAADCPVIVQVPVPVWYILAHKEVVGFRKDIRGWPRQG